jgi:hypothetical protein
MTILMQPRSGIQVQSITGFEGGQTVNDLLAQYIQEILGLLAKHLKKAAEGRLAGDGLFR